MISRGLHKACRLSRGVVPQCLGLPLSRCPDPPLDPRPRERLRLASTDDVRRVNRLLAPLHAVVSAPED
ncbi:hypothetical protein ACWDE9_43580 [Streptomyces olivaceoviridis]